MSFHFFLGGLETFRGEGVVLPLPVVLEMFGEFLLFVHSFHRGDDLLLVQL